MTKNELVRAVAENTEMSLKDVNVVVDELLATIVEALKDGEKIQLTGFGNFEVKDVAEKQGVNPATGEKITIPASRKPVLKFSKAVKESIK